jgi:hypothetical protein
MRLVFFFTISTSLNACFDSNHSGSKADSFTVRWNSPRTDSEGTTKYSPSCPLFTVPSG